MQLLLGQILQPSRILSSGQNGSLQMSQTLDRIWVDLLTQPGIYTALANVGLLTALIALGLFLTQWGQKMMAGDPKALAELVWPILVIVLLSNQGAKLADMTLGVRDVLNGIDQNISSLSVNGLEIREAYQLAALEDASAQVLMAMRNQCDTQVPPKDREECQSQQQQAARQFIEQMKAEKGDSGFWDLLLSASNPFSDSSFVDLGIYITEGVIGSILWALASAFQFFIEIGALLTAMFGPLAVGAALFSTQGSPVYTWISGFVGLWLAKIGLHVVSGVAASVVVTSTNGFIPLFLPLFMGLLAPILALAVAYGGGTTLLAAFSIISATVLASGTQLALSGLTKSISRLARRNRR